MKKKKIIQTGDPSQKDGHDHEVTLSCHAPEAKEVFVAGTFNDWKPDATPLQSQPDGEWAVTIPLAPGSYEYKFVVDGQWCCAPGTPDEFRDEAHCCENSLGTMNCVLEVS